MIDLPQANLKLVWLLQRALCRLCWCTTRLKMKYTVLQGETVPCQGWGCYHVTAIWSSSTVLSSSVLLPRQAAVSHCFFLVLPWRKLYWVAQTPTTELQQHASGNSPTHSILRAKPEEDWALLNVNKTHELIQISLEGINKYFIYFVVVVNRVRDSFLLKNSFNNNNKKANSLAGTRT